MATKQIFTCLVGYNIITRL